MITARFKGFVRWRWASSMALVAVACVPVAVAALLIPGEISSPFGPGGISPSAPSRSKRTEARVAAFHAKSDVPAAVTTAPGTAVVPRQTAEREAAVEPGDSRARARGYFVPEGETDDSRPIEPRKPAHR